MKIKTISRDERAETRDRVSDSRKAHVDPTAGADLRAPREYVKALNRAKTLRMFAKPFVASLEGHSDMVFKLARSKHVHGELASGDASGTVKVWNLGTKKEFFSTKAHDGFVRGLSFASADAIVTGGTTEARIFDVRGDGVEDMGMFESPMLHLDCCGTSLATCGSNGLLLWDVERTGNKPSSVLADYAGVDGLNFVKFNPGQPNLIGALSSDRGIALYDVRSKVGVRKTVMRMRANSLSFNPMEPLNFVVASEDYNLYTFDVRKLKMPTHTHRDFTSAVMSVEFSPTGKEFVAGSYDRTMRIFKHTSLRSRELYHSQRMQRVYCVEVSSDGKHCFSGSGDCNVRMWKTNASEDFRPLSSAQLSKRHEEDALVEKYEHMPEIRSVMRKRHAPRAVHMARKHEQIKIETQRRKAQRVQASGGTAEAEPPAVVKEVE